MIPNQTSGKEMVMIRPVAQRMFDYSFGMTVISPACIVDFGLDTEEHLLSLTTVVVNREVTVDQLDAALGDGPAITELVNGCKSNPFDGIIFKTAYDMIRRHTI